MNRPDVIRAVLVLLLLPWLCFSQIKPSYFFENISREEGLSQGTGYAITEYLGYMWFGTQDGLNRYDGYGIKVYKSTDGPHALNNSFVQCLLTGSGNRMWVGTGSGLNLYDPSSDAFRQFSGIYGNEHLLNDASIRALAEDQHKNIWILTDEHGLFCFHPLTRRLSGYFQDDPSVQDIRVDAQGRLWASNLKEVFLFADGHFRKISLGTIIPGKAVIRRILMDSSGRLWVGTNESGCFMFKITESSPLPEAAFTERFSKENGKLKSNQVIKFIETYDGKVWVATFTGGITVFDHKGWVNLNEPGRLNARSGFADNSVYTLFEDSKKNVWIGYSNKGIGKYDRLKSHFNHIGYDPDNKEGSLDDNMIFSLCRSGDRLFICTETGGIRILNLKTYRLERFPKNLPPFMVNEIRSVQADSSGKLWLMNWHSLISFDPGNNRVQEFRIPPALGPYIYAALIPGNTHEIWISGQGLKRLDMKTRQWIPWDNLPAIKEIENYTIRSIFQDSRQNIWLGTLGRGLLKYEPGSRKVQTIHKEAGFNCDNVRSFFEDGDVLWVGTDCGLYALEIKTGRVQSSYSEKNQPPFGLPNNVVYAILQDSSRNLWLSSNTGLAVFSPENGILKSYDMNDGLRNHEFNTGAAYMHTDGVMFFGGVNGLTYFDPKNLVKNAFIPPVVITRLKVMDSLYPTLTRRLDLNYKQNFIEFEFAALSFSNSGKNQYQYLLEGIDKEWVNAGTRRFANYTNLPPGNYTFRVKGSNNDQVWNPEPVSIDIRIQPPLWGYWWFFPLSGLFVFSVAAYLYYRYVNEKLQTRLRFYKLRSRIAEDLHDELGSTLSGIALSADYLKRSVSTDMNDYTDVLDYIGKDASRSLDVIRDTVWALNPEKDTLSGLIEKFHAYAVNMCRTKKIRLDFKDESAGADKINLDLGQRKNLYLSLKEIVNNAVKHSGATLIRCRISRVKGYFVVHVEDNGTGIDAGKAGSGNGLANIRNRMKESLFDLELSSTSCGTGYTIKLPTRIGG